MIAEMRAGPHFDAIHVFFVAPKTWMPGTGPGMTEFAFELR
jgi:hypothetical protein